MPNVLQIETIPDETFVGLVVAAGILCGAETYRDAYRKILGDWAMSPANALPRSVRSIAPYLSDRYQEEPKIICSEHTLLPYYSVFAPAEVRSQANEAMLEISGNGARKILSVAAMSGREPNYMRFCSACACEQIGRYKRSTWLRSHQQPAVTRCHRHGLELQESSLSTKRWGMHNEAIALPEPCDRQTFGTIWSPGMPWRKDDSLLLAAQVSHEVLLSASVGTFDSKSLSTKYWQALFGQGCRPNKIRWNYVKALLNSQYNDSFQKRFDIDLSCATTAHWLRRIVASEDEVRLPLYHVLMIGCLFDCMNSLENGQEHNVSEVSAHRGNSRSKISSSHSRSRRPSTSLSRVPSPKDARDRGKTKASSLSIEHARKRSVLLTLVKSKPSLTRVQIHGKMKGGYVWLKKFDAEWMNSVLPPRFQPRQRSHESKRVELLALLKGNPGITRTELLHRMGDSYRWLNGNDAEWMESVLPRKVFGLTGGRVQKQALISRETADLALAEKISALEDDLDKVLSRGRGRINYSALSRLTGTPYPKIVQLRQLPATARALNRLLDSPSAASC